MTKQREGIDNPHDHDVLSGRGNFVNYHAGNEHFRGLVRKHKVAYVACPKPQKGKFSKMIYDEIRAREPPGRFLKQDDKTKLWYDIGEKKALDKTRQALREGAPEIQKELTTDEFDDENEEINENMGSNAEFNYAESSSQSSSTREDQGVDCSNIPSIQKYINHYDSSPFGKPISCTPQPSQLNNNNNNNNINHINHNKSINRGFYKTSPSNTALEPKISSDQCLSSQMRPNLTSQLSLLHKQNSIRGIDKYELKQPIPLQSSSYGGNDSRGGLPLSQVAMSCKSDMRGQTMIRKHDRLQQQLQQKHQEEEQFLQKQQQQYQLNQPNYLHLLQQQQQRHDQVDQKHKRSTTQDVYSIPIQQRESLLTSEVTQFFSVPDSRVFQQSGSNLQAKLVENSFHDKDSSWFEPRPIDPLYVQRNHIGYTDDPPSSPTSNETEDIGPLPARRSSIARERKTLVERDNSCNSLKVDTDFSFSDGPSARAVPDFLNLQSNRSMHRSTLSSHMSGHMSGTMSSIDVLDDDDSSDDEQHQLSTRFNSSMRLSFHGPYGSTKYPMKSSFHGTNINSSLHDFELTKGYSEHSIFHTSDMSVATIEGSISRLMTESDMSFASVFDDAEQKT